MATKSPAPAGPRKQDDGKSGQSTTLGQVLEAHRGELAGCEWAEAFVPMQGRGTIKPYAVLP